MKDPVRINATPDIAGNERAVERLRAGLESAVAVAVAGNRDQERGARGHHVMWLEQDVVRHATADAAPRVAALLETMIAERLARRRLYTGAVEDEVRRN